MNGSWICLTVLSILLPPAVVLSSSKHREFEGNSSLPTETQTGHSTRDPNLTRSPSSDILQQGKTGFEDSGTPIKHFIFKNSFSSTRRKKLRKKRGMPINVDRKGVKDVRWPNNLIPYSFKEDVFSSTDEDKIHKAMDIWSNYTCVKFSPAKTGNRIVFQDAGGCNSITGMAGGAQTVNLAEGCRYESAVLHELGHAIGMIHEQRRPDRDDYVRVLKDKIKAEKRYNFDKYPWDSVRNLNVSYDYLSIMHYRDDGFSASGDRVMEAVNETFQNAMGRQDKLSFRDIKTVNLLYNCQNATRDCSLMDNECPGEGFVGKDCQCWCPGDPYAICENQAKENENGNQTKENENKNQIKEDKKIRNKVDKNTPRPSKSYHKNTGNTKIVMQRGCHDKYGKCSHWFMMNYYKCSPHMKKICRKTCNICTA